MFSRTLARTLRKPTLARTTPSLRFRWFSTSNGGTPEPEHEKATETTEETSTEESVEEEVDPLAAMTRKCEELEQALKEEKEDARKQYMSTLAEMENVRRIAKNDVEKSKQYGIEKFAKSLLPTSDNLQRALESTTEEAMVGASDTLVSLHEGVLMTEKELMKVLASQGIEKFGAVGDVFDPNKYEAMFEYEDPALEPGSVGQVITPGYLFKDRVLRPSQVGFIKRV